MQRIVVGLYVLVFVCIAHAAPNWTAEQREVWAQEERYFAAWAKGDVETVLTYYAPDYVGWYYDEAEPSNKDARRKGLTEFAAANEVVSYEMNPLAIKIAGDFAFADYTYSAVTKNKQTGEQTTSAGRWTDIFAKRDGKWVQIGDSGGDIPKK